MDFERIRVLRESMAGRIDHNAIRRAWKAEAKPPYIIEEIMAATNLSRSDVYIAIESTY